jgi:hypothetical protein
VKASGAAAAGDSVGPPDKVSDPVLELGGERAHRQNITRQDAGDELQIAWPDVRAGEGDAAE